MRKHFPFPSATFFTRTPRGPRAENVPTTTRSPARVLLFSESARENEKNARDHGKSVRVIRTLAMMFMFDVKGASIWSFFFVKERRRDKKGRGVERKFAFLSFSKTISTPSSSLCLLSFEKCQTTTTTRTRTTRTTEQTEIFWTSNLHRSLHFLRRRRRTHTDFENAASGDAGEAAALEPRREHVDVGIACSRPKDDDSFPQTSL